MYSPQPKMEVLLVEDNPADAWLVRDLIFRQTPSISLTTLNDGDKAEQYLLHDVPMGAKKAPDIILLDLNLPKKSGRELLNEIRTSSTLHDVPVFVISSSRAEKDRTDCQTLGANLFLTKPENLTGFVELVRNLVEVEFPRALKVAMA